MGAGRAERYVVSLVSLAAQRMARSAHVCQGHLLDAMDRRVHARSRG